MSLQVKNTCDSFFRGFCELSDPSASSREKGLAFLKVASYFLTAGLLALAFLIVREINKSLLGRNIQPIGNHPNAKFQLVDRLGAQIITKNKGQFPRQLHQKISVDDKNHWRQLTELEAKNLGLPEYVNKYPLHLRNSGVKYDSITTMEEFVDLFWLKTKSHQRAYSLKTGHFDIDDIAFQNFALKMLSPEGLLKGMSYDEIAHQLTKPWECTQLFGLDKNNEQHTLPITILIRARNNAISSRPEVHPEGRFFTEEEINNNHMYHFYQQKKAGWNSLEIFSWFNGETGNLRKEVDLNKLLQPSKSGFAPVIRIAQETTQQAIESLAIEFPDETDQICWLNLANAHMDGGILKGPSRPNDTKHGSQEENTISDCNAAVIQASVSEIVHGEGNDDGRARYKQGFHIPPGGNFFMKTAFVTGDRAKCNSIACAFADFRNDSSHIGFSEFNHFSENNALRLDDEYKRRIFMDIYGVLATAKEKKQLHLVLGGSGCGAFKHDHMQEAQMWKSVLAMPEFKGCFQSITFAITGKKLSTVFRDVLNS